MTGLLTVAREVLQAAGIHDTPISVIELDRSAGDAAVVAVLVFAGGAPTPRAFLKATADPTQVGALEREHANLVTLEARAGAELAGSIPRPLFFGERRGLRLFACTVLPGQRLKNRPPGWMAGRSFPDVFDQVIDWLDRFATAATAPEAVAAPEATAIVAAFRENHRRSAAVDRLLDQALEKVAGRAPAAIATHGDFCVENVLYDDGGPVGVIDFDGPLDGGWPMTDLLHFLASLRMVPRGETDDDRLENHRRVFHGDVASRDRLRLRSLRHLERIGIEPAMGRHVAAIAWAGMANRSHRLQVGGSPDGLPRVLIRDGHCANLELLAEDGKRFLLE